MSLSRVSPKSLIRSQPAFYLTGGTHAWLDAVSDVFIPPGPPPASLAGTKRSSRPASASSLAASMSRLSAGSSVRPTGSSATPPAAYQWRTPEAPGRDRVEAGPLRSRYVTRHTRGRRPARPMRRVSRRRPRVRRTHTHRAQPLTEASPQSHTPLGSGGRATVRDCTRQRPARRRGTRRRSVSPGDTYVGPHVTVHTARRFSRPVLCRARTRAATTPL